MAHRSTVFDALRGAGERGQRAGTFRPGDSLADFAATAKISMRVKQGIVLPPPEALAFPELP